VIITDVINPQRIDRIPDKTVVLLSSGNYIEQGLVITRVEVRLYQEKTNSKLGPYSIITTVIETNEGLIERTLDEGYRGPNALEEAVAYLTSHPLLPEIILRSVIKLKKFVNQTR
jgi:hypothetical protein